MRIAVVFSSKECLEKEYGKKFSTPSGNALPPDFFAEGDSYRTINALIESLRACGYDVCGFEADENILANLSQSNPDLVFNIAEGLFGDFRESYVPTICECLNLPYTGSSPLSLAICLNKARAKEILSFYGIPTPAFKVFLPEEEIGLDGFEFPGIVKPISEGSSKGIFDNSVVRDAASAEKLIKENLAKYNQPVIIEAFIEGAEFTVAMWGNGNNVEVLPIVEINYGDLPSGANKIYSYEAKWIWDTAEKPLDIFKCPAAIDTSLKNKIEETVLRTFRALDLRDWCRIDVRLDSNGTPNILEINPLPGILPDPQDNSCFPKAARTAGYSYDKMLGQIVRTASARYKIGDLN